MKSVVKALLIIAGSLSLGLGIVGIFVPVLPTTPFLLLAAICYARSSDKLYYWVLHNPWFGKYIRDYREKRGIPLRAKIWALSLLWISIGYSALFVIPVLWVKILLVAIAVGVTIHILSFKTL